MDTTNVECANCLAVKGEPCTTVQGNKARPPHAPRVELAAAPDKCGNCGAKYGEPCFMESGKTRIHPHLERGTVFWIVGGTK